MTIVISSIRILFKGLYRLCECGCLELIPIINNHGKGRFARFKNHHNSKGKNHPMYKLGRIFHKTSGYWFVHNPLHPFRDSKNYKREHVYNLEIYLSVLNGTPTYINPKIYDVHHIDGNRSNNHWSNLQVLTRAEHTVISLKNRRNRK